MRLSIRVMSLVIVCLSYGCSGSNSSMPSGGVVALSLAPDSPKPPTQPAPGNGINGQYRGDLTFTEENTSYGWPAHLTVLANLQQNGADVTGDFDLVEVMYSGGFVKGTVDPVAGGDNLGTFRADFLPDDLGDHFAIETKITSQDSGRFEGTFEFAEGVVGRGNATFTRVK